MEKIFPINLRPFLDKFPVNWKNVREVRMRCNKPLILLTIQGEMVLDRNRGWITMKSGFKYANLYTVSKSDLQECVAYLCQYSLYAYEDELRQGFITIRGGHRVGISGQVVLENGQLHSISCISSLNLRIAHDVSGCAAHVFEYLWEKSRPCHTLILSPPGCGKTTLLRDLVRLFSDGHGIHAGQSVSLVDERSEVAACCQGIPQNNVGIRTDVMDHCPKASGVEMMVRAMGPDVVAFDEIGTKRDMEAVDYAIHSGCCVLSTLHGKEMADLFHLCRKPVFKRYIFLNDWGKTERVREICDENGQIIFRS